METKDSNSKCPYRQIRADYDDETITVYQAYSEAIATAAVQKQKLNASDQFSVDRMTWIKPSWNWMMYRSGFGYKDARQSRILAIKMKHEHFFELLRRARVNEHTETGQSGKVGAEKGTVVVQWDPERSEMIGKYDYRSIQIGISRHDCKQWIEEWIESIEDVTERAKKHKEAVDQKLTSEAIIAARLVPTERPFEVPDDVKATLRMTS
jgi:hypothetical protein